MLAGKKLLLADDSLTIQKVVELTFADEGVQVVCVSNGRAAVERIKEFAPDVVLADAFMPEMNGYEVCQFIKQNDELKHIPVMLLFGSFEPFEEAEARRVGADDSLSKPFQSIRTLIDKVGLLISTRRPDVEAEAPTAELPDLDVTDEPELLSQQEIEITTADTQPLPPELGHITQEWALPSTEEEGALPTFDTKVDEREMESNVTEFSGKVSQGHGPEGELLLDLGDYGAGSSSASDEFQLDIDLDEVPESAPVESGFPIAAFAKQAEQKARAREWNTVSSVQTSDEVEPPTRDQLATTLEFERPVFDSTPDATVATPLNDVSVVETQTQPGTSAGDAAGVSPEKLSTEVIDAIARRVVEQLSEKVVQEIAWEVVPQLAELLIKRQLEEKNS